MDWLRTGADLASHRRHLLFPPPAADSGLDIAQMADSATVCGCVGVTKGAIIGAIHEQGVNTLSQLKEATRASTGCGAARRSARICSRRSRRSSKRKRRRCSARASPSPQDNLREILRSQRLRSVQDVLEIYGNGPAARSASRR